MVYLVSLVSVVLSSGFYTPGECRERIEEALAVARLKWIIELPSRPVPKTCEYLLTPEEREMLFSTGRLPR